MKVSKYNLFLFESQLYEILLEAKVQYLTQFGDILKNMKSPVAKELLNIENQDLKITTNYLDISEKDDEISFYGTNAKLKYEISNPEETYTNYSALFRDRGLDDYYLPSLPEGTKGEVVYIYQPGVLPNSTNSKIAHFISDDGKNCFIKMDALKPFPSSKPQKSSVGRIARRMLDVAGKAFTDREIEDFVHEFRSKVHKVRNRTDLFELVEGDDIRTYYSQKKYDYTKESTLHNSCMRYDRCQSYLDIYTDNTDVCKLLILRSPYNKDLIIGRALVWTLDTGEIFMDRIYYSYKSDVELFKDYAIKNGWCYKKEQDSSPYCTIEWNHEKVRKGYLTVKLEHYYYNDYPYMDTLKYLNEYEETISSNERGTVLTLESTEGGRGECETCRGDGNLECPDCEGVGREDCPRCDGDGENDCRSCDASGRIECSNCDGSGEIEGEDGESEECPDCYGNGQVDCEDCDGDGQIECSRCDGDGRIDCQECGGSGRIDCPDCG